MTREEIGALAAALQQRCELIETHISFLILTEAFVYKIKKPLKYSFLDFSTLEKRRWYCEQELHLNRRLAPEMYLSVVAIVHQADGFHLEQSADATPKVVDYALKMKRMDTQLEMDRQLQAGKVNAAYLQKLAHKVADFHRTATIVPSRSQSSAAGYAADFNDILGQQPILAAMLGESSVKILQECVAVSDGYLSAHAALIDARAAAGFVRDVHGDLHTRNIFAYPEPVIFDCIEFNDHFRQIDVLNEIAFFCMDLEANGFDEFANTFLECYTERFPCMPDTATAKLFVWFKCYRANVRAKVNTLRAAQSPQDATLVHEVDRYLHLMARYTAQLRQQAAE